MSEIETTVGETCEIEIETIPTSGFTWTVAGLDEERLRLVSEDVEVTSDRVGGGAVQRFRFQALAAGEVDVRLELSRSWESKPPAEERTYRVTIRG